MTTVVNLRAVPYDVYIGRAGKGQDGYFGNPVRLVNYHSSAERSKVLIAFKEYFEKRVATDAEFANRCLQLRGKRLGCFCKPMPCHGDTIAAWVDSARCDGCGDLAEVAVADPEPEGTAYPDPIRVTLLCSACAPRRR